ncbi:hypothetical protein [Nocardioides sp. zg-DK7169]|uniref:hypothetical protein n=1 Tax=Nocardioides sp. zg-DK7169 TaxID=2736600 RepID=UPI0015517450|nr:hypothetical protein [Nocardioides sp. zg-DK7169]NPC97205.1 hypothetical protein [Nocardioides sp. zg-DK7169]
MLDTGHAARATDRPRMRWVDVMGPDGRSRLEARWVPTARASQVSQGGQVGQHAA